MTARAHPDHGSDREDREDEALPPPRPVALEPQTWREIAHLLSNLPVGIVGFVYIAVCIYLSAVLSVTVIGLPLLALTLLGCRHLGRWSGHGPGRCCAYGSRSPAPCGHVSRASSPGCGHS